MAKKNGNEDVIKMLEANREKALVMSKKVNPDYTLTAPGDFQKTADYIEKWTGEKAFLSDSPDLVNQNYIAAQYAEGKKNAADQGFWGELGGFLAQSVAGEIVLGTVEGFGYLLDFQHWGSQLMGGEGDWGNWLSDYMEDGKEWIREAAPIYQDPDNENRSTWENMLHGDGWWAQNGVSVASSLSILIPVAGWTRGVGLAGKGARYLGQGARVGKWGATAAKGTKTVDKVMDVFPMMGESTKLAVNGIHKATVSRLIESQMEATAVFKEKYDYYMEQEDMTEEEARKAAGEAAAFTYNWNWGAMLTDIPQYMLLGSSGRKLKGMLHSKKPGFIQNSKLLNRTKGLRSTATTMFSEGLEESYQYIVSEEGKRIGDIQAGLVDPDDTTLGERLSKYSKEAELHTSALFGALGGGVFSAAGPKATQLINKSFRKGEQMMTEADVRKREAQDRFTRLAHSMDAVDQATKTGDEEAIFAAKGNMAFDMAKEAVLANNWKQAREAMAQLKNATPEEKEAYEIKENFGEFIENIDEWIEHMDVAADIVDRAKSKYTYGLAEGIARLQFDKYMYDTQAPKLREKVNSEMKNVVPNFDDITKDGNTAVELGIENQGIALAIKNLEKMVENGKMPASDMEILNAQIAHTKEVLKQGKETFKKITTEGELTEDDRLALEAIEGGTADDAISLMAKLKLMELRNKKGIKELNYWTSNEGRKKFKRDRAEAHKKAKAEAKEAKDKADQDASAQQVVDPYTNGQEQPTKKAPISDLNVADVAKAIKGGAKYQDFATTPEDIFELKKAVADYNQRQEADPNAEQEEIDEDLEILPEDEVTFDEETEDEVVNVLDDESVDEADIEVDPVEDLAKELEAAEAHEEIEAPMNVDELDAYRITDNYQEMQLSKIPGQLAWLSSNNSMGDPTKITEEQKALTSFLETPDSSITDLEVEFDFNREWIKNNPKEIYTRMMKALSQGQMPSDADIGYMPIQATFTENGKPVEYRGFNMRMNLHDPSFFYRKDRSPKYKGVSEYQAKIAILHKKAIISQMLKGGTVTAKVNGKSKGSIINETTDEGEFAQNFVLQTVRKTADKINFLVGDKTGRYVTHKKMPRLSLGAKATPGAIYTEVSTANGSKFPLRLQINNVSTAEATIVHAMYVDLLENPQLINDTISEGIIKYIKETTDKRVSGMMDYLPNFEQMTYQELLNHLVYEGSRTIAHKDATLTHFVNIEKGGVKLPNVVQFGKTKMPAERLAHEKGKLEFINWMVENKRRQVDASRLGDATYKGYLNDNKILSTNVSTTPEGNIFIQPVVSYSTNMRVETSQEEQIQKASAETKEAALLSFKEDLAYELTKEGGPNAEIVADLKRQIKVLEGKTSTKKADETNEVDRRYTYEDFAKENKGKKIQVQYSKYKKPFDATITGEVETVMEEDIGGVKAKYVGVQVRTSTGKLLTANPVTEIIGEVTGVDKLSDDSNKIYIDQPTQQASEVTSETASTVANTIKMFQTGIKTEDNGEIKVSTVESIELDEVAETPTKTAEEIIEEEVTTEEITEIAKEEGIQEEEVIEAVKEEVKKQINEKKITKPSTLLQKVGARIKKMFVNLMLAATIFNATGFTMNTSTEGSKTYDNTTVESLEVFDNVYKDQEAINKEGNLNVITESFSGTNENYLVVDKTGQVAHLFEGDSLVTTYEVGTGKNKGDEQTKTIIRDGKVMWQEGNKQTGAGIYTVGSQGTYKHSPSFTLQNERGISVPTVLHETLSDRKKLFENNNVEDNRMSYGCVNFQAKSLQDLGKRGVIKPGSKVFILPDNPSNKFQSVDGKVQFVSNNENVNRTLVKYEAQDIILKANGVNNIGKEFLTALSENKAELMQLYPTISNDTYNQITKIAYGIFGQESSFGTFGGGRGKLGYVKDEIGVFLGKDMSVGVTQMRLSSVNKKTREVFDINSMDDIKDDVTKASIATMSLLMDMYENQIPTSMKGDFKQLLPLGYSNRAEFSKAVKGNKSTYNNAYVNNVNKNGNKVTVFLGQTDKAPIPAAPSFKKSTKKQGVEAVVNFRNRKAHGVQESSKIQDYAEKLAKINATKIKQGKIDKNIDSSDFEENPC